MVKSNGSNGNNGKQKGKKRLITVQVPERDAKLSRKGANSGGGSSSGGSSNIGASSDPKQSITARGTLYARADSGDRIRPARPSKATSTPFPGHRPSRQRARDQPANSDGEEEEPKESWPGPWSTARELADKRDAVAAERQERLEKGNAEEVDEDAPDEVQIEWEPSGRGTLPAPKQLSSLEDICIKVLLKYVDAVECFGALSPGVRAKLTNALCRRRLLTADNVRKFCDPGAQDLSIPDCSSLDDNVLVEVLKYYCAYGSFSILSLGMCGRVFNSDVAKVLHPMGQQLKVLELGGSYRLFDKDLDQLLRCCSNLEVLQLDSNPCLNDLGMEAITTALPQLTSLSLRFCQQLTDSQLQKLSKLKNLQRLSLDFSPQLTEDVMAEILSAIGGSLHHLSLNDCEQLADTTVFAISKHCNNLSSLNLGGLYNATFPAFASLFDPAGSPLSLEHISLRGAYTVNDELIGLLAQSCASRLRTLELDSVVDLTDAIILSLTKHCSTTLEMLEISFCRGISDKGLGYLVDHCPNLKELGLWGCTQITDHFLKGHNNPFLNIHGKGSEKRSV